MDRPMRSLRQLLAAKGPDIYAVGPEASVFDALTMMAEHDIGAVMVFDAGQVVGILTERDYARKGILAGRMSQNTPVRELMTADVVAVPPEHTVQQCMALMADGEFRHLPVIEDGRLIGVVSIRDLVKEIISNQKHVIEDLKHDMLSIMAPNTGNY